MRRWWGMRKGRRKRRIDIYTMRSRTVECPNKPNNRNNSNNTKDAELITRATCVWGRESGALLGLLKISAILGFLDLLGLLRVVVVCWWYHIYAK